jgi:3-isopropylmalate/(R)-2-methylmalate dehydratase small subunit
MKKFGEIKGIAAPLPTTNVDTDQIIPKQFLTTVERDGLSSGLFYNLRFSSDGALKRDFILNRSPFNAARILIAGDNFGCGSSREHAAWALDDFGISCVVSSSFADIFYNNCLQNGLLPAVVSSADLDALLSAANGEEFSVLLKEQIIVMPSGTHVAFTIEARRKAKLLQGLDDIGETLQEVAAISRYEVERVARCPWLRAAR